MLSGSSTANDNNCKFVWPFDKENMDEVRALLLHSVGHQLLLGALGADDVLPVRDEALSHLRRVRADVQTFSHQERSREIETQ